MLRLLYLSCSLFLGVFISHWFEKSGKSINMVANTHRLHDNKVVILPLVLEV